ncbi:MAG: HNH endonuclease signature motif containing protein [Acidobacteriota bacterium]
MRDNTRINARTRKLVFQEALSHCPFCGESDVDVLDVCHIDSRGNGGAASSENLILACATCHRKIDSGQISIAHVLATKRTLAGAPAPVAPRNLTPPKTNVLEFHGRNSGVVANEVKITTARAIKLQPPDGIIGADADRRSYIKRLIDRYNDFKRADMGDAMDFRKIYGAITREFKCKWDFVPLGRFDELATYLQRRIDGTILGKVQKKRGGRNYSTFEEYLAESR